MTSQLKNGFLKETGWLLSDKKNECLDENEDFIPWYNYAVIDFLKEKLNSNISVFEFGCGYSTLFYAKRCARIYSVESRLEWINKIQKHITKNKLINSQIRFIETKIAESIDTIAEKFDLIIIDSDDRLNCAISSYYNLAKNGIIILDNSERKNYSTIFDFFKERGFKNITFSGLGPLRFNKSNTTIFYRVNNIFDI